METKTNSDRIRNMSNEELAEMLAAVADWMWDVDFGANTEKWLEWLNREN